MSCTYNAQGDYLCKSDRSANAAVKLKNKPVEGYVNEYTPNDVENMRRCIVIDELKRFSNYGWGPDLRWYDRVNCPEILSISSSALMKEGYKQFTERPPSQLSNRHLNDIDVRWNDKLRTKEQLDVMYVDSLRTKKMLDVLM